MSDISGMQRFAPFGTVRAGFLMATKHAGAPSPDHCLELRAGTVGSPRTAAGTQWRRG